LGAVCGPPSDPARGSLRRQSTDRTVLADGELAGPGRGHRNQRSAPPSKRSALAMNRSRKPSRRTILQAAGLTGGAAAALGFLSRIPTAEAAVTGGRRRLVIIAVPNDPIGRTAWAPA